jgi:hypothetical protein
MSSGIIKCECGKRWKITREKMPYGTRDSGSEECSCGRVLQTWHGGYTFVVEEIKNESDAEGQGVETR